MGRSLREILDQNPGHIRPSDRGNYRVFTSREVIRTLRLQTDEMSQVYSSGMPYEADGVAKNTWGYELVQWLSGRHYANGILPEGPMWDAERRFLTMNEVRKLFGFSFRGSLNVREKILAAGIPTVFPFLEKDGEEKFHKRMIFSPFDLYVFCETKRVENGYNPSVIQSFEEVNFNRSLWSVVDLEENFDLGIDLEEYLDRCFPAIEIGDKHLFRPREALVHYSNLYPGNSREYMAQSFRPRQNTSSTSTGWAPARGNGKNMAPNDDACEDLWLTVIERAVMDLQYLQRFAGRKRLKKHEREKLRRIAEEPPDQFFEGGWFEDICDYLQINSERIRSGIDEML